MVEDTSVDGQHEDVESTIGKTPLGTIWFFQIASECEGHPKPSNAMRFSFDELVDLQNLDGRLIKLVAAIVQVVLESLLCSISVVPNCC